MFTADNIINDGKMKVMKFSEAIAIIDSKREHLGLGLLETLMMYRDNPDAFWLDEQIACKLVTREMSKLF
jgi:hypothetical protein